MAPGDHDPAGKLEFAAPNGGTFAGFLRELEVTYALFDFNHPMTERRSASR